jgi:hypothetical protein
MAYEIANCISSDDNIDEAIVSYFAIGEASQILPTVRRLEARRSSGEWDPAANSILRSRFYHLQALLYASIDLGPEASLGIDRASLRLSRGHLKEVRTEMEEILADSNDLAAIVVANARAQSHIRNNFNSDDKRFGTGLK